MACLLVVVHVLQDLQVPQGPMVTDCSFTEFMRESCSADTSFKSVNLVYTAKKSMEVGMVLRVPYSTTSKLSKFNRLML